MPTEMARLNGNEDFDQEWSCCDIALSPNFKKLKKLVSAVVLGGCHSMSAFPLKAPHLLRGSEKTRRATSRLGKAALETDWLR
jgi:hypothetical protein